MKAMAWAMALTLLAAGCTTLDSYTVNPVPAKKHRKRKVYSEASGYSVFFIPFGTSFVEDAHGSLARQCRGGRIQGVTAKYDRTSYFFVGKYTVRMTGFCLQRS